MKIFCFRVLGDEDNDAHILILADDEGDAWNILASFKRIDRTHIDQHYF